MLNVADAFRQSVNLVFIRMMQDIVAYVIHREMPWADALLAERGFPG